MNPRPNDPLVSIVARTPGLDAGVIEAVVTLPTFRRPQQVLATLKSLAGQRTARRFAVIVMENEADLREGAIAASPLFNSGEMNGLVIIAHQRGNCAAYNAGWSTALMQFPSFRHLLVIDDDEIADPDWLENMCRAAEKLPADIVGGPQVPVFEASGSPKLQGHPVFQPPYRETGVVPALYSSGNLLVSRKVLEAMPQPFLDLRFNFMGGGDSDFLSRSSARGFVLGWCNEGVIREDVPARRTEWDWVRARALRNGVISTLVENKKRRDQPMGRLIVIGRSLALLATAPLRMAARLAKGEPFSTATYPIHVALGRVGAEFGYANEQYREPEKN
jgi:GT2 family glycosyltransferase